MIDIGRAFKAPFADKDWLTKTAIGFVSVLFVITIPAVYGAMVDYIRSVSRGGEILPTWDDYGRKWTEGLLVLIATFLYFLPVVILFIVFVGPGLAGLIASDGASDALGGLFAGGLCLFWVVAVAYSIAVSVFFSAALTNYAMKGTFGAFFEFTDIMTRVRGGTGYFTAWLYTVLISFGLSAVTSALSATGIGLILYPAATYLVTMMIGHVLGQWAAASYLGTPGVVARVQPPMT